MNDLTAAPECPAWCTTTHNEAGGWLVTAGESTKTCRHVETGPVDVDGNPAVVELERFASIDHGRAVIEQPVVRVFATAALSLAAAAGVATVVARLAELASAAGIIAA